MKYLDNAGLEYLCSNYYNKAQVDGFLSNISSFPQQRTGLTNSVYVAKTGNDSTGDGTSSNPFLTISRAIQYCKDEFIDGTNIVHIGDGTYSEIISFYGLDITLTSLNADPSKVIITTDSYTVITANYGNVGLAYLTLQCNPGGGIVDMSNAHGYMTNCNIINLGGGTGNNAGVCIRECSSAYLNSCTFTNCLWCTLTQHGFMSQYGCTATNCTIAFRTHAGIAISGSDITGVTTKHSSACNGQLFG